VILMTELTGGNILIDKEEYDQLKLKANLGEALLSHMLRNYLDDTWADTTRFMMDECSLAFWNETIDWQLDEEENEDD